MYTDSIPQSFYYLNTSLEMAEAVGRRDVVWKSKKYISEWYSRKGIYDSAFIHLNSIKQFNEHQLEESQKERIRLLKADHMHRLKKKQMELKMEQDKNRFYLISVLVILFVFLALVVLLYQKQKLQQLRARKKEVQLQLEIRNQEITANLLMLIQKNEILKGVKQKLEKIDFNKEEDCFSSILSITNELNMALDEKLWKEFEVRFTRVNMGFYDGLLKDHPNLTKNEKRLCAFLKLNMSSKEISSITNQTTHSITIARTRLRKKLGLSNQEISLHAYLDQY